ncbi:MAG: aldolase/citrate lyase family protein [Planctomycetota bacterium]|nr:aldolase/citrate lyase family protein [Planctomycetota bacterium]
MKNLRDQMAAGEMVRVVGMGRLMHHNIIQIIGFQGGFDGLWFDIEHGSASVEQIEIACLAAKAHGMDTFVRVAPTDYATVTRCYESGASGVMAAQINTAEQAEQFVQWSKFYPRGNRGLNVGGVDGRFATVPVAEFCETTNREHFVAIQIETLDSLNAVDDIVAIDGVDMLFVGPSDLSQALGMPGDFMNEKCVDAVRKVGEACRRHNKPWGAVTISPQHAAMMVEHGCLMLSPTSDAKLVNLGIQAVKSQYAEYFK